MKRLVILLVLIFTLPTFASCGECTEHTDSNGDGFCDTCFEVTDEATNFPEIPNIDTPKMDF